MKSKHEEVIVAAKEQSALDRHEAERQKLWKDVQSTGMSKEKYMQILKVDIACRKYI